ncbi:MAG: hypothetical protein DRQ44_00870 [Gammaproteobacteria bacterium]|nr:MAG: hypothetical protein DRQ44_00870 [Gammaproteobacteria bacterium]
MNMSMNMVISKISFSVFLMLVLSLLINNVSADEKPFLTVDELIKNGYTRLSGLQLIDLLKQHKIVIRDIETDAVSISTRTNPDTGNSRKSQELKNDSALYFLDARLLARAPSLEGKPDYKVAGDELIATDGVRTYHITFYEKQGKMFGARDIDNGNVFFEIILD